MNPQSRLLLPRLLLFDTCGLSGTVALAEGSAVVATELLPGRSASERLIPVVRALLAVQGWQLAGLAAIVVVHGPGSFTGVRVGLSAAKGLSEASGVPLIALSRLAVLTGTQGHIRVALDAGRGEFYFGEYADGRCIAESLLTHEELLAAVGQASLVVCEQRVEQSLRGLIHLQVVPEPAAESALPLAILRYTAGEFDDAATLDANYLRRTDLQLFARPKRAVE